jgi:hypothetical protein
VKPPPASKPLLRLAQAGKRSVIGKREKREKTYRTVWCGRTATKHENKQLIFEKCYKFAPKKIEKW